MLFFLVLGFERCLKTGPKVGTFTPFLDIWTLHFCHFAFCEIDEFLDMVRFWVVSWNWWIWGVSEYLPWNGIFGVCVFLCCCCVDFVHQLFVMS